MKKIIFALVAATVIATNVYASDYQGEENRGSIFQVIGDFIKGDYKVDGKPLKEKGIIQSIADETQKMKLTSVDEKTR